MQLTVIVAQSYILWQDLSHLTMLRAPTYLQCQRSARLSLVVFQY
jgi:hypothetical protein